MAPRTFLFVVVAVLTLVPGWTGWERLPLLGAAPRVTATRVPLDPRDPARRRVGRLTFMGGVALASPDRAFGGFSALHVIGDRVTLLSDGGNIVRLRLASDGSVHDVRFGDLPGGPGTGWRKLDRDSEALAVDPATGAAWIGFERANAIWRYSPGLERAEAQVQPPAMRGWPRNGGSESLVRRRDGSFVAIAEEARRDESTRALLVWPGDPTTSPEKVWRLRYRPPAGYDPADATELPDGRLLVLNRGWRPLLRFDAVLVVIDPRALRPGAVVEGRQIAHLAAPLTVDNFEGVAATVEKGRTVIWLASDDNRTPFERTLLMKFRLD